MELKLISGPEDSEKTKEFETYTDNRTNTYKILFNAGGNNGDMDYSIVPHIIDKANNKQNKETQYKAGTEAKTEFTIDKKSPQSSPWLTVQRVRQSIQEEMKFPEFTETKQLQRQLQLKNVTSPIVIVFQKIRNK